MFFGRGFYGKGARMWALGNPTWGRLCQSMLGMDAPNSNLAHVLGILCCTNNKGGMRAKSIHLHWHFGQ